MSFARYAVSRVGLAVPVLIGILAFAFFLTHVLPTNPALEVAGVGADKATVKRIEHQIGTDRPLATQLYDYYAKLLHGDLGHSLQSQATVSSEILHRLPSTLELITCAIPIAGLLALGMALFSADRTGIRDYIARLFGTIGTAVPDYLFALALILVFFATLKWAPAPLGQAGGDAPTIPRPTGAYLLDAALAGNGTAIWVGLVHLILPVAALSMHFAAPIYRVARTTLEDAIRGPFVEYAVMMGGSKSFVWRAVIKNAIPPVLTIAGIIYSQLLGGAVLVEVVFGWGGLGQYGVQAILYNDYFAIQGFVLTVAVFSVLVYLAVDLTHAALDPRVRAAH